MIGPSLWALSGSAGRHLRQVSAHDSKPGPALPHIHLSEVIAVTQQAKDAVLRNSRNLFPRIPPPPQADYSRSPRQVPFASEEDAEQDEARRLGWPEGVCRHNLSEVV